MTVMTAPPIGIRKGRAVQPQGSAGINWVNPITRGLAMLTSFGANALDVKRGAPGTVESGASLVPTKYGMALRSGSGPAGMKPAGVTDANSFLSATEFTVMMLVRINSLGTLRVILGDYDATGSGSAFSISMYQDSTNVWFIGHVNPQPIFIPASAGAGTVTLGWHWLELTFKQNVSITSYVDGAQLATDVSSAVTNPRRAGTDYRIGRAGAASTWAFDGDIAFHGCWNRMLLPAERASVRANPWQLFAPINDATFSIVVPAISSITLTSGSDVEDSSSATAIINTGVYASADVTTTGWTGSPYTGDLASNINEVTSSNSEYIESPDLTAATPITFDLNNALAAGVWEVDFTAKYTVTTGDIKFTLLNSGGSSVGDTGWITVASTFTGYTPVVTTSGTATKIKVEVR